MSWVGAPDFSAITAAACAATSKGSAPAASSGFTATMSVTDVG